MQPTDRVPEGVQEGERERLAADLRELAAAVRSPGSNMVAISMDMAERLLSALTPAQPEEWVRGEDRLRRLAQDPGPLGAAVCIVLQAARDEPHADLLPDEAKALLDVLRAPAQVKPEPVAYIAEVDWGDGRGWQRGPHYFNSVEEAQEDAEHAVGFYDATDEADFRILALVPVPLYRRAPQEER